MLYSLMELLIFKLNELERVVSILREERIE